MNNKTETIVVRLAPRLKERLEAVAAAQQMTLSQVIRAALEDYTAPMPQGSILVPIVGRISGQGIEFESGKEEID